VINHVINLADRKTIPSRLSICKETAAAFNKTKYQVTFCEFAQKEREKGLIFSMTILISLKLELFIGAF